MPQHNQNFMLILCCIYLYGSCILRFSFALSFTHDLHNLTIIYKPNSFVYHFCRTSHSINAKRIRWHYESLHDPYNDIDTSCKQLFHNSDCFDFYYGPSISLLVIKEPDVFIGKYTCQVNINSTYEIESIGWIDVKLPLNETSMKVYHEFELGQLAKYYNVPFIFDAHDLTSFGKRVQVGGMFHVECKSIESSYPIEFLWMHLKNHTSDGIKTIRFVQNDGNRIIIKDTKYSSSLFIYTVDHSDDGDYVCVASNAFGRSFSSVRSLIVTDAQIKPLLNYNNIKSRSITLHWFISNQRYDRFNHFIIYFHRISSSSEKNLNEQQDEIISIEDYQQVLFDPRTTNYNFTFQMIDLIPFATYEFQIQGFIGSTPSDYSNRVVVTTLDTVPEKIENLHGFVWNKTSVIVHWTPPISTNGPNFYYVLYYTTNTSIPFSLWTSVIVRTYPFYIISLPISSNFQIFIRVASFNAKGSMLSDFYRINYNSSNNYNISTINNFQCLSNNFNQRLTFQWSIDYKSQLYIDKYVLYYSELTQMSDDFIRIKTIPNDLLTIDHHSSYNLLTYEFHISELNFNFNRYHILRLQLSIIDKNQHQLPPTLSPIYCILSRKFGKNNKPFLFLCPKE